MNNNENILSQIISKKESNFLKKASYNEENKEWLSHSKNIAIQILSNLRKTKRTQKELASLLNVSAQYVNKIVKGNENLTLETISKIEKFMNFKVLNTEIKHVASKKLFITYENKLSMNSDYSFDIKEPVFSMPKLKLVGTK